MQLLTPREAQDLWPLMTVDDVIGAAFLPTDGQASPSDIVQALARGARSAGVDDPRGHPRHRHPRRGRPRPRRRHRRRRHRLRQARALRRPVVPRARPRLAGVNVPLVSVQHQYLITDRIDGVTPGLPTLRDPDRLTY